MYGSLFFVCLVLPAQYAGPPDASQAVACVADDAEQQLAAETARLVQQLNAMEKSEREAAEAELVKLGPEVLNHLPAINRFTPGEVKERLGRVRSALETAIARSAADPSRVTLQGEMALASALEALEQQTGNRVAGYQQRSATVIVDFERELYWRALDEILDQAELAIEEYGGQANTIVLRAKGESEVSRVQAATYSGAFRFEPVRLESRRDLRNPTVNGLRLTISIAWEPRIKPIALRQALNQVEIDAGGGSLAAENTRGALNASVETGVSAVEIVVPIELPGRALKQIDSLRGALTAMVPGSVQAFTFTDLQGARDVEKRNAGVTVTLEQVRRNVKLYEVLVRVAYDEASNALESHRGWIFNNEAYLLDAAGQRITNVGLRGTRQGQNEAGVAYLFPSEQGLDGFQFVYKTPALILNLPITYELKNIQLP